MPKKSSQSSLQTKKGVKGHAAQFITRASALRKLQLSLRDFRKLCILKGIYPRDPKKKTKGTDKTYYHIKDIKFLAHEPLLDKFRDLKTFLRKVNRVKERKEFSEVRRMRQNKPQIRVQHLIRERYPMFVDALRDIDDALSLVALFAQLPGTANAGLLTSRLEFCSRLIREFHIIVARNGWLKCAFLSVKGIYYRAVIDEQEITWLVPHAFTPHMPRDVDYRVMATFLQLYETLIKFVNFRLYKKCNLAYPPALDRARDADGEVLTALRMESESQRELRVQKEESVAATASSKKSSEAARGVLNADSVLKRMNLRSATKARQQAAQPAAGDSDDESADDDEQQQQNDADDAADGSAAAAAAAVVTPRIFESFVFHFGREIPLAPMEFIVLALGGRVETDAAAPGITHRVVDRPVRGELDAACNYVQPQWIVDSLNRDMALPVRHYAPGVQLPAHLSPFVQYQPGDYVPPDELMFAQWTHKEAPEGVDPNFAGGAAAGADSDDDGADDSSEGEDDDDVDDDATAGVDELGKSMMKSKHRRLLAKIERHRRAKGARVELLRRKRTAFEAAKDAAPEPAKASEPAEASQPKRKRRRTQK